MISNSWSLGIWTKFRHALLFEGLEGEYDVHKAANARTVRDFDEGLTRGLQQRLTQLY